MNTTFSSRFIIEEPFRKTLYKRWDTVIATKQWVSVLWNIDWIKSVDWYFDYYVVDSWYTDSELKKAYKDVLSRT